MTLRSLLALALLGTACSESPTLAAVDAAVSAQDAVAAGSPRAAASLCTCSTRATG